MATIDKTRNEFSYAFQINKRTIFDVAYYRCGGNKEPHFSTMCDQFGLNKKTDFDRCGQCQEEVLPKNSIAMRFFKKWNEKHLSHLSDEEIEELKKDVEELKESYNYIESERDNGNFLFDKIVKLSNMDLKK